MGCIVPFGVVCAQFPNVVVEREKTEMLKTSMMVSTNSHVVTKQKPNKRGCQPQSSRFLAPTGTERWGTDFRFTVSNIGTGQIDEVPRSLGGLILAA